MPEKCQVTTMCPMNCLPTQCGMVVEVKEEIFENPQRVLHPLRRVGERAFNSGQGSLSAGRWGAMGWD